MNPHEVEEILTGAYRRQAACYSQALEAARSIDAALGQGADQSAAMQRLSAMLDEVGIIEADIREDKRLWQQASRPAGLELRAVLDQVAGLIQALRACVGSAEQTARAETERLAPKLDQLVRGRHMQAAYQGTMAAGKSSSHS